MALINNFTQFKNYDKLHTLDTKKAYEIINELDSEVDKQFVQNTLWTNIIKKKLSDNNIDFDILIKIMQKYNLILSGSFILQVILNETYEFSDMDFYLENVTENLLDDFKKIGASFVDTSKQEKYGRTYINYLSDDAIERYNLLIIKKVYNGYNKNCKIQLIEPATNILEHLELFDLDICKNYWDGKKFYVKNLENIQNKIAYYKSDFSDLNMSNYYKMFRRIIKYQKRGFKIVFPELFSENFISFFENNFDDDDNYDDEYRLLKNSYNYYKLNPNIQSEIKLDVQSNSNFDSISKCKSDGNSDSILDDLSSYKSDDNSDSASEIQLDTESDDKLDISSNNLININNYSIILFLLYASYIFFYLK